MTAPKPESGGIAAKGERIRRRSEQLIRLGCPPGAAIKQAVREIETVESNANTPTVTRAASLKEAARPDISSSLLGRRLVPIQYWICVLIYILAPLASIASFIFFVLTGRILAFAGFWVAGFVGMFALGLARQLDNRLRRSR